MRKSPHRTIINYTFKTCSAILYLTIPGFQQFAVVTPFHPRHVILGKFEFGGDAHQQLAAAPSLCPEVIAAAAAVAAANVIRSVVPLLAVIIILARLSAGVGVWQVWDGLQFMGVTGDPKVAVLAAETYV